MAIGGAAVSITASAVGLAADAAVGSVKLVGKGVKAGVDALSDEDSPSEISQANDLSSESHLVQSH